MTDTINTRTNLTEAANRDIPQAMTSKQFKEDLANAIRQTTTEILRDTRLEIRHVFDPTQCGYIVRRHFDALVFMLLGFVAATLLFGIVAFNVILQMHH